MYLVVPDINREKLLPALFFEEYFDGFIDLQRGGEMRDGIQDADRITGIGCFCAREQAGEAGAFGRYRHDEPFILNCCSIDPWRFIFPTPIVD